jgi:hypothetical protein
VRHPNVHVLSQIVLHDVVRTPSGREALVIDFVAERASCEYLDDFDQVTLRAAHLKFIRKSTPAEVLRNRSKRKRA